MSVVVWVCVWDRKSVVEGKSVGYRLDLGGGRVIKWVCGCVGVWLSWVWGLGGVRGERGWGRRDVCV
mgnify:CR=1 FL=1